MVSDVSSDGGLAHGDRVRVARITRWDMADDHLVDPAVPVAVVLPLPLPLPFAVAVAFPPLPLTVTAVPVAVAVAVPVSAAVGAGERGRTRRTPCHSRCGRSVSHSAAVAAAMAMTTDRPNSDRIVAELRRHAPRRHAGVVHRGDPRAGEDAAAENCGPAAALPVDDEQPEAGHHDRDHQRQHRGRNVIGDADAELEGEHRDEMHRPDAAAQRHRACEPPADLRPAARLANPSHEIERNERRHDRDRDGQQNKAEIVMAVQRRSRQDVTFRHRRDPNCRRQQWCGPCSQQR